ncbi:deoxyguanosinetriphosphate triphosphohydrolase [Anaerolineae bacterium CFX9]|nr:deoxyguanosinetriphosphate triphosphohydrolase [Kamptonema cortianum]MDL1899765.1 deoxyguanosinetriphosphate triphosphohydrolase [Anaerolineae bacterium CFX9]
MYLDRQALEQIEAERLAPYAQKSAESAGREHAEAESHARTAYQRDRDRILHSAAFRRLEYKTQVFANDEDSDYYRTRLTHTLEVAQIGRTIARALAINEDLVEAICLAHDLGHPPFGHAGERALDEVMREHGGYNHNHQSYRVVTELERRYPGWLGLNLTRETLAGLAKHETDYDLSRIAGLDPNARGSLEAQVANITDELAYNAHDLDDGLIAQVIQPEDLQALDIWRILCDRLKWRGGVIDEVTRHQFIRELVGMLVDDVLTTTRENIERADPQSVADVQALPDNLVCYSPEMRRMASELKQFLYQHMYFSYRIVRMQRRSERFIEEMFRVLVFDFRQLPPEWRREVDKRDPYRVVADYIASMTDRSALLEYRRLFDPMTRP